MGDVGGVVISDMVVSGLDVDIEVIGGVVVDIVVVMDIGGVVIVTGADEDNDAGVIDIFGDIYGRLVPRDGVALQVLTWRPTVRDASPSCPRGSLNPGGKVPT